MCHTYENTENENNEKKLIAQWNKQKNKNLSKKITPSTY